MPSLSTPAVIFRPSLPPPTPTLTACSTFQQFNLLRANSSLRLLLLLPPLIVYNCHAQLIPTAICSRLGRPTNCVSLLFPGATEAAAASRVYHQAAPPPFSSPERQIFNAHHTSFYFQILRAKVLLL